MAARRACSRRRSSARRPVSGRRVRRAGLRHAAASIPAAAAATGRKFRYANYSDWGGGDYQDLMAGVDHVIATGRRRSGPAGHHGLELRRLHDVVDDHADEAVQGGLGRRRRDEPDELHRHGRHPRLLPDYFGGEFWDVFDRWRAHSAMFNVKGVTTPTLIQHGEQDLRVPHLAGLRTLQRPRCARRSRRRWSSIRGSRTGSRSRRLTKDAMERNLEWFDRWIKGRAATTSSSGRQKEK